MPHPPGCPKGWPLIPKLRRQFAEFLQHTSLKRLGILYQSTCVGFGYGLCGGYFLEHLRCPGNPISPNNLQHPSLTRWPTNINVVPIDYGFRPRLRGRLTLRRLALRRNPWTFGGSVSHTPVVTHVCIRTSDTSRQPSRVALRRLTERSATAHRFRRNDAPIASVHGFSPDTFSAQKPLIRPVSCYAFFKGWLLLSQPPGCYGIPTSFHT